MLASATRVGGPYFEDLQIGDVFDDAPALTLNEGHAAMYQATFGDRLRLPLSAPFSEAVTGTDRPYVHPLLVCHISIGQTTTITQRVRANLFYRRVVARTPVFVGDTLRTSTEVIALKQNTVREGKPATGLAALRIQTLNTRDEVILDYVRCPMLPLRDPAVVTGHHADMGAISSDITDEEILGAIPASWDLDAFTDAMPARAERGHVGLYEIEARETVSCAPELVRVTLNLAAAHTDPGASPYGQRLVYGGHTISLVFAQVSRALPRLVTILAWHICDHTGPVFEGDLIRTEAMVTAVTDRLGGGRILDVHACGFARRDNAEQLVLDWRFVALEA